MSYRDRNCQLATEEVRRPIDLSGDVLVDWDGLTEVMVQNGCLELVDMDELDQVGNNDWIDQIFEITLLEEEGI